MTRISSRTIEQLRHYVYVYVDPRDGSVFYVGKGVGRRCLSHLVADSGSETATRIRAIRAEGLEPSIEILVHGLPDEETALRVEAAAIDLLGVSNLTNNVRGWKSVSHGRMTLDEVNAAYDPRPAKILEPAVLIRINQLYRYSMTQAELYDATRGIWVVGEKADRAEFAFAVFHGTVREVYRITAWLPAGSTFSTRDPQGYGEAGRWEFVGVVASDDVRRRYVDRSVTHYFSANSQNPIRYVNLD